ncbi:hypothetical protein HYN59_12230 [Flavobacterium album]|uniref:Lipocalin-like domain-containing protein n=1 Tax=Flavobacterium album TaxID=2175091 RepID=A0A2S1QZP3_9FLAO|nr:hypothetical protein [Flavobacterium album]AWH85824.1 hypothetical protein HYN59_12230 [Flavobacterium album]
MKTIKMLFAVVLLASIGISCDTEPADPVLSEQNPDDNNPGDGGNNGGGNNNGGDGTYWPLAVGNTWTYTVSGTNQDMIITGTEAIDGETYYKMSGTTSGGSATGNSYLRYDNGTYYMQSSGQTNDGTVVSGIHYVVLKDNIAVNATWTDSFTQSVSYGMPGIPDMEFPVTIAGKMLEKGISYTVGGHTYNDVIHSRIQQTMTGEGFIIITTTDYWFAKNVGPVKIDTITAQESIVQTLVSYDLN